ncbi:MAG: tetratricopeptide repeat protein [Verrucomicrobiia bacterium]
MPAKKNPAREKNKEAKAIQPKPAKRKSKSMVGPALGVLLAIGATIVLLLPASLDRLTAGKTSKPPAHSASPTNSPSPQTAEKSAKEKGAELINRGNELLRQNRNDEALQAYEEARTLLPQDEDVYYNLGIVLTRLGRTEDAIKAYQRALELFPNYAEAHNNLGNLLLRAGNLNDALVHFNAAIAILPDYAVAYNSLGIALRELGLIPQAAEAFLKASSLDTNYWQAKFNLAGIYMSQSKWDEAIGAYREVLRLQPEFTPAQDNLRQAMEKKSEQPR